MARASIQELPKGVLKWWLIVESFHADEKEFEILYNIVSMAKVLRRLVKEKQKEIN